MRYSRSGRKKSNRRTRKVLTHLPAVLYKSLKRTQRGGATIAWPSTGEYFVQSIVGTGNDGRLSGSTMSGQKCFAVVSSVGSSGRIPRGVLGESFTDIKRPIDTSGNTQYYYTITHSDAARYNTDSLGPNANPTATSISPTPGGTVTFPHVTSNLMYVPGNGVLVYKENDAVNTCFIGTVSSYTNNGGTATLVINNIANIKGSYSSAAIYKIQASVPYTPQPTLFSPIKIAVDSVGNIFIVEEPTDGNSSAFRVYDTNTKTMTTYGRTTGRLGAPNEPRDNSLINFGVYQNQALTVDKKSDVVFIGDWSYHYVRTVVKDNGQTFSGKPSGLPNSGVSKIVAQSRNNTIAGNQDNAGFQSPKAIAIDPRIGRGYVSDNNRIMMVDMQYPGNLPTPSGDRYYYSKLWQPPGKVHDMVVDNSGNLFVLCTSGSDERLTKKFHAVWKIVPPPPGTKEGYNKTPIGTDTDKAILDQDNLSTRNPAGMPPLVAPVIFAGNKDGSGYEDKNGTNARFNHPMGISVDSKNILYIADMMNNVIRGITPQGDVFTVAGAGGDADLGGASGDTAIGDGTNNTAKFSFPVSVAVDSEDNIYVLDRGLYGDSIINDRIPQGCTAYMRIRKIILIPPPSAPTGFTLVSSDPISATFSWASSSALTGYEARGSSAYFQFLIKPSATAAEVSYAIDGTTPYTSANRGATASTLITSNATQTQKGFYINNLITLPLTPGTTYPSIKLVAFNKTGQNVSAALSTVAIPAASKNYTILKAGTIGSSGFVNGPAVSSRFASPKGLCADNTNTIYVADTNNHCIRKITPTGETTTLFGTPGTAGSSLTTLNAPADITIAANGIFPIFVADTGNNRILSITADGVATLFNTLPSPTGITVYQTGRTGAVGSLYVSSANHAIYFCNATSATVFAGIPGTAGSTDGAYASASFKTPSGIHYSGTTLYVADSGNHLIRVCSVGQVRTLAGTSGVTGSINGLGSIGLFNTPTAVTVDAAGYVYVADSSNHSIRKVSPAGLVSIYSGRGLAGSVDGNSTPTSHNANASTASYNLPTGICNGASGMMFISEVGSHCIRALSPIPPPTAPTSLFLTAVTSTSATITWAGDTGAVSYSFAITPSSPSIVLPTVAIGTNTATFTGLTESTAYSLRIILTNAAGSTFPPTVNCITQINSSIVKLNRPTVSSLSLTGTVKSLVTGTLSWEGLTLVPSISYTLTPSAASGATTSATQLTGTMPANQRSPFTISGLQPNTTYSVSITGTIPNVPSTTGPTTTTYSVTSNRETLTTGNPEPLYIGTIAGIKGVTPAATNATATPTTDLLKTQLNTVRDIVSDGAGNLYIAARTCILKLSPPATPQSLYVFDATQTNPTPVPLTTPAVGLPGSTLSLFAGSPTAGVPSTTAQTGAAIRFTNIGGMIYSPSQSAFYISDIDASVVVRLTVSGSTLSAVVVAGIPNTTGGVDGPFGTNRLAYPKGLALDTDGSLYIAPFDNVSVRKLSTTGVVSTITGGAGWPGGTGHPGTLTRFPDGSIYVACAFDHTIRKLTPDPANPGAFISSLYAGASTPGYSTGGYVDGPLLTARFNGPQAITVDSNYNMYVLDSNNYAIRVISGGNVYTLMKGDSGSTDGPVTSGSFRGQSIATGEQNKAQPALFCDSNNNLYLSDTLNGTIRLITTFPASQVITETQLQYYRTSGAQASSAVAQTVSSALAQSISGARASSAVAQVASQAVASSAIQQTALSGPVLANKQVISSFQALKTELATLVAAVYSPTASLADKATARSSLEVKLTDLQNWIDTLAATTAPILMIAPMYQDRGTQFAIPSPYLQSVGSIKLYDAMRKAYITIDSTSGHMIPNIEIPSRRPFVSGQRGNAPSGPLSILSTDILLSGDLTLPTTSVWTSYFDTVARRYFYTNTTSGESQYDHPFLPTLSTNDQILTDVTTEFLPAGWMKLQNAAKNLPYYLNVTTTETSWAHPAPPPNPATATLAVDATLFPAYKKYISTTAPTVGKVFYVNSITKEAQWNFPDSAFNVGPSTAQQASSALAQTISGARASSATAQVASSAVAQTASSALAQQISGARESSAVAQVASSAVAQTASSALAQQISGARASSATAQVASSALAQQISGARASSATAQVASSALAQSISGAEASSATAQVASSALAQRISGAQASSATAQVASSALAYRASSALAQSISGAQASSATAQVASSAVAQGASSALAQRISGAQASSATAQVASSAVAQGASSALAQRISGAQASSATAQFASSALQQRDSSAQQQAASSAVQQNASSAQQQTDLAAAVAIKDTIKSDMVVIQAQILSLTNAMNGKGPSRSTANIPAEIDANISRLFVKKAELSDIASRIFQLSPEYQDASLQTIVPDNTLSAFQITKVFDTLRNAHIFLDANQRIVKSPLTPAIRAYTSGAQYGGGKKKGSRKSSILLYRV